MTDFPAAVLYWLAKINITSRDFIGPKTFQQPILLRKILLKDTRAANNLGKKSWIEQNCQTKDMSSEELRVAYNSLVA